MNTSTQNSHSGLATSNNDEDEIFKSLSHQIRRDIIKLLGEFKTLTFTQIKTNIKNVDSPSLSYHIKSLKYLIRQDEGLYILTDVGMSALKLMDHIDQSDRFKNMKRKFVIANITTILCWTITLFFVPFSIRYDITVKKMIFMVITLNIIAQINFQTIWQLWGRSWNAPHISKGKKWKNQKNKKKRKLDTKKYLK